jgi:hypothetical protein
MQQRKNFTLFGDYLADSYKSYNWVYYLIL